MSLLSSSLSNLFKPKKKRYLAVCEYWGYLDSDQVPNQEALITRMVATNPHNRGGRTSIGSREGLLFSDIRLHMALVLRSKNPHVFRPDLFHESFEPSAEALQALSQAKSLLKMRYLSEEVLPDDRHLQFMPHLADAVMDLGNGLAVYDVVSEDLLTRTRFCEVLDEDPSNAAKFENHVRVVWAKGLHSGNAATKGLIKKGLPELQTDEAHLDQQVLVREVIADAARVLWEKGDMPEKLTVQSFHDEFELQITPAKTGPYKVRILRMRGQ